MKGQRKRRGEILHLFVRLRPAARLVRCRLSGGSKAAAFDKPKPASSVCVGVCVCIHANVLYSGNLSRDKTLPTLWKMEFRGKNFRGLLVRTAYCQEYSPLPTSTGGTGVPLCCYSFVI